VRFCRYVDDYVLFAKSEREASRLLADLAQVLGDFEGLSLQKLKTRIMRKGEFLRSYSHELDGDLDQASLSFLRLRLRYDPYSATAAEDYEAIRQSVSGYDVLGMLARETRKSRVHQQLTKKLLLAVRFIADGDVDDAVVTVGENLRILLPLFGSVAALLNALVPRSKTSARELLARRLEALLTDPDGPAPLEITRMMTVRLLASLGGADAENLLWREYEESDSVLVRKECIWGLCRLKSVSLLRPLLTRFDRSSSWERRALIAGSYVLAEEGATFRRINSPRFSPFEHLILTWCEKRGGSIFAATPDDI